MTTGLVYMTSPDANTKVYGVFGSGILWEQSVYGSTEPNAIAVLDEYPTIVYATYTATIYENAETFTAPDTSLEVDISFVPDDIDDIPAGVITTVSTATTEAELDVVGTGSEMGEKLLLTVMCDNHIRDRIYYKEESFTAFKYVGTGGDYNKSGNSFVPVAGGAYQSTTVTTIFEDYNIETDIEAEIRTLEVLPPENDISNQISSSRVFLKTGISKQLDKDGNEVFSKLQIFEGNSNVTDEAYVVEFKNYMYGSDINEGVDTARINGTRNANTPDLPASSELNKTVSLGIKMTNEGSIQDLKLIITPRMESGSVN